MERAEKWGLVVSVVGILVDAAVSLYQANCERADDERLDELEERVQALEKPARSKRRPKRGDDK